LLADRARLTEILLNLLSNAIKFTEPGGAVTLAARRNAGGEAVFEVRGTGVGMTSAEIEIALAPVGQVDAGLDRKRNGAGLGLFPGAAAHRTPCRFAADRQQEGRRHHCNGRASGFPRHGRGAGTAG
jgi:light-regulated signal transduction histidine kinase (bacteriophytochrome)